MYDVLLCCALYMNAIQILCRTTATYVGTVCIGRRLTATAGISVRMSRSRMQGGGSRSVNRFPSAIAHCRTLRGVSSRGDYGI